MIERRGVRRTGNKIEVKKKPLVPEFHEIFTYCKGDIVWYGELQYIAKDFVAGETPDNSENWEIYIKTRRMQ